MKTVSVLMLTAFFALAAISCLAADETTVPAKAPATKAACCAGKTQAQMHAQCGAATVQVTGATQAPATSASDATTIGTPAAEEAITPAAKTEAADARPADPAHDTHCPDVAGKSELTIFHEAMHTMHMALNDGKYGEVRQGFPKLDSASVALAAYKCPMGDKCPPECKKDFETKKANLIKSVDELRMAVKGDDDKRLGESYMAMHENYIKFASVCSPKEATTKETKSE